MKRTSLRKKIRSAAILCGLSLAAQVSQAQAWKLYAITGQQTNDEAGNVGGTAFAHPDHALFEVNLTTGALTFLKTATWVNDSNAIGFNPDDGRIYHTAGSEAYSNNPLRNGHDQGQPDVQGVGYQDSQYMEAMDLATLTPTAIFNANPCPNPDETLPCFGLAAPRPTWVLPEKRRDSTETGGEFRQTGEHEYHAARGLAWSDEKNLFYLADELGIFKMTPAGESTFLSRPAFPIDGKSDEAKAIAFVKTTSLFVGHRNGATDPNDPEGLQDGYLIRLNPDTGEVTGQVRLRYPEGGGLPEGSFGGLLGLAQDPGSGILYGVRKTEDNFARELVTINPNTGVTKLVGNLGQHVASITFGRANGSAPWKLYAITGQQTNDDPGNVGGTAFAHPDHALFEVNTTTGSLTFIKTLTWVNDSNSIGFNPVDNRLYHTAGSDAYSNNPVRNGHDQGLPNVQGVGYQDSQYMEAIDLATLNATAIFNAAPCPNPDETLPCFGLAAPRPTWVLPEKRRDSTETGGEFRQTGEHEYHAARGLAWSQEKQAFYLADELGIFKMTPTGESTFIARPSFPIDGASDESKAIAFVTTTSLLVSHRNGAVDPNDPEAKNDGYLMTLNPDTGEVLGQVRVRFPTGGGEPDGSFGGILGLAQHPETGVLYGVRKTDDNFARELVTIDPETGESSLVGSLGQHVAAITFGGASAAELKIDSISQAPGTVTINWSGGAGKFLLQKRVAFGTGNWINVLSTTGRTATVPKDGATAFFRVQDNYTGPDVTP